MMNPSQTPTTKFTTVKKSFSASANPSLKKSNASAPRTTSSVTRPSVTPTRPTATVAPRPNTTARPVNPTHPVTTARPTASVRTTNPVRPQTTARPTTPPRTTPQRNTTPRRLQRWQIYTLCGVLAAILLLVAIIVPVVVLDNQKHNKVYATTYRTTARQGYYSQIIGTVPRQIPTTTNDGGLVADGTIPAYPTYGSTANYTTEQKEAVIAEARSLTSCDTRNDVSGNFGGAYKYFDKDGYQRDANGNFVDDGHGGRAHLYAHTAAKAMYYQGVDPVPYISDNEPAVVKCMTFQPRAGVQRGNTGYNVTGLYAAPGELVTVTVSADDLAAVGGTLIFHIGQCLYNGQSNNIWAAKPMNRMPLILNTLYVTKDTAEYDAEKDTYTAYLGSYLGGPIYLRNTIAPVSLVMAGALEYRHFILGYTTPEEYARLSKTTTPYFDLEIWENGILHSGPVYYAYNRTYDEIFHAAILWEKITLVSDQVGGQGVVMLYDPFVAAGAAVAFPGRASTNCPAGWMGNALNAEAMETSGAWGVMHEYNHNFQGGWELPGGGEVSNNALNLASYLSFTKISSFRQLTSLNTDTGLGGWNAYTNASWAAKNTLFNLSNSNQLVIYATLLHNLGAKNFMTGVAHRYGGSKDGFYREMSSAAGYNFDYFFKHVLQNGLGSILDVTPTVSANQDCPAFVPISTIYQTGRSIINAAGQTEYIQSMQPYEFAYGENLTVDLRRYVAAVGTTPATGTIVVPNGVTFDIINITEPAHGTLQATATAGVYTYTPSAQSLASGKINVSLRLHADSSLGAYAAAIEGQTVDLVLEFQQSHEMKRKVLQRTVYRFDHGAVYNDPLDAFQHNFAGATAISTADNVNTTENSNTDIWLTTNEYNAYGANTILTVRGKIYVPEAGTYRLTLRGRVKAAVAISLDGGQTYPQTIQITNTNGDPNLQNTTLTGSLDLVDLPANSWVDFQEILMLNPKGGRLPFIGLGWGKIERNAVQDEDGNVTESEQVTLNYATGYRASYVFPTEKFHSDYLFTRTYTTSYDPSTYYDNRGTLVEVSGFTAYGDNKSFLENLFDDDKNNYMHTNQAVTTARPFSMTVDLGAPQTVNTCMIYRRTDNNNGINFLPRDYTLYGALYGNDWQVLATHTAADDDEHNANNDLAITFPTAKIRYYRLVVTATYSGTYLCMRYLQFDYRQDVLTNGRQYSPDDAQLTYRGTWRVQNTVSKFGRVYVGKAKDKMEFTFDGTRFGIQTALIQPCGAFTVYIDGKKMATATPRDEKDLDGSTIMGYLSPVLASGTHRVKIVGQNAFNVASVITW